MTNTKRISINQCTGRTRDFYRLIQDNLYEKNYKDAPVMRHVLAASVGLFSVVAHFQLRGLLA